MFVPFKKLSYLLPSIWTNASFFKGLWETFWKTWMKCCYWMVLLSFRACLRTVEPTLPELASREGFAGGSWWGALQLVQPTHQTFASVAPNQAQTKPGKPNDLKNNKGTSPNSWIIELPPISLTRHMSGAETWTTCPPEVEEFQTKLCHTLLTEDVTVELRWRFQPKIRQKLPHKRLKWEKDNTPDCFTRRALTKPRFCLPEAQDVCTTAKFRPEMESQPEIWRKTESLGLLSKKEASEKEDTTNLRGQALDRWVTAEWALKRNRHHPPCSEETPSPSRTFKFPLSTWNMEKGPRWTVRHLGLWTKRQTRDLENRKHLLHRAWSLFQGLCLRVQDYAWFELATGY